MKSYDLVLIGTGQATGTILSALLESKLSIAIVEKSRVGGTCVNWGCTPTKTLVANARAARMVQRAEEFGIPTDAVHTDFARVMQRVNTIRNDGTSGFRKWLEQAVDFYPGAASFADEHVIRIAGEKPAEIYGKTIVIHTGAVARKPDIPGIDAVSWLDNRRLLDLKDLPEHLLIVGGSYIGMEFGQAFSRFGSKVTIIESGERIIFREDSDISQIAQEIMESEGVNFRLGAEIRKVEQENEQISLTLKQGSTETVVAGSHLLIAVGRTPDTKDLNLEAAGIKPGPRGHIPVDDYGVTAQPHIYALGDVNGNGAFTHTSVHDGQVFLDHYLQRGKRKISNRTMIYAMYIDPPLARVGMNETEARSKQLDYLVAAMPMSSVSRAKEKAETQGIMKVLVDRQSKKLLGAVIFGTGGDEIIGLPALAIQSGLPYTALQETVIPHPTVAELFPWLFDKLKDPD